MSFFCFFVKKRQTQMPAVSECTKEVRPVYFENGKLYLIDQKLLPGSLTVVAASTKEEVFAYIRDMTVRGAPAIGAAGGFGMCLAAASSGSGSVASLLESLAAAKAYLDSSRPTAVNLAWATGRLLDIARAYGGVAGCTPASLCLALESEAQALAEEDVRTNRALAMHGAALVPQGANVLHICNTGALATVDIGTALGVIYECHRAGKGIHVWVSETRPRLQGAKLTAWELMRGGVPMHLIVDSASGMLMASGRVDVFVFGADRVAANGDTANKVGTYKTAVVAHENGIPAYACVPTSTIDLECATGAGIHIEERSAEEVVRVGDTLLAPEGVPVFNPAFDVTPAKYITGIITEEGVCYRPFAVSLRAAKLKAEARVKQAWEAKLAAFKA
jgi:methylthioribose-1-phosphate isomerase